MTAGCDSFAESLKKSVLASLWFIFLTFPIMVIRVDTINKTIDWRWMNMAYIGIATFLLSFVWRWALTRKEIKKDESTRENISERLLNQVSANAYSKYGLLALFAAGAVVFPHLVGMYQTNIMISCLIYIVLGLGLNMVVGIAGLLHLGYVAFYAVGAYSYALLNMHYGIGFWTALPIGAVFGVVFAVLLGLPVLRLRGDYLAIVTLGFGEIVRLVLENWGDVTMGPSGISGIDRPGFFGVKFGVMDSITYAYYIMLALLIFTIFVINRLQNSRLGRALLALREDEIASQAMGIDRTKAKLLAFALGSCWAGLAGVVFAAKTTFINPASFTFWESAIVLSVVVIGGMGSIRGVIAGALILILMPEYLRAFSEFRMLVFGATMVLVMVFRPQGLIRAKRKIYTYVKREGATNE
ncbi:ABC transporter permease subunit [Salidesulfovibrio onnuriiensis]|uniref:ABC transporter permease subunit n=1 Tax=Salidesulfovibrio onnuriiensis TaxID=2583823 RepID=UPI003D719C7F